MDERSRGSAAHEAGAGQDAVNIPPGEVLVVPKRQLKNRPYDGARSTPMSTRHIHW